MCECVRACVDGADDDALEVLGVGGSVLLETTAKGWSARACQGLYIHVHICMST